MSLEALDFRSYPAQRVETHPRASPGPGSYFYNDNSDVQREMGAYMKKWIDSQSHDDKRIILERLTKDAVRQHKNRRKGHEADQEGHGAHGRASRRFLACFASSFAPANLR